MNLVRTACPKRPAELKRQGKMDIKVSGYRIFLTPHSKTCWYRSQILILFVCTIFTCDIKLSAQFSVLKIWSSCHFAFNLLKQIQFIETQFFNCC